MVMNHPYTDGQCPKTQQVFFLIEGLPLVSCLIASYVGASVIGMLSGRISVRSTDRLILDLVCLKTIDMGRRATSYTEFLCRIIKILHKTESGIPLKVYAT